MKRRYGSSVSTGKNLHLKLRPVGSISSGIPLFHVELLTIFVSCGTCRCITQIRERLFKDRSRNRYHGTNRRPTKYDAAENGN